VKGNARADAVELPWEKYLMGYMVVSVNETWVVIVGCGIGTGVADVRIDALVSASDGGNASASGNVQIAKMKDAGAEVTRPDSHNSSALHRLGCLREKRRQLWHDNPVHRLGVCLPLHNQTWTGGSG